MTDLVAFLRARLDDTERKAREAAQSGSGSWFVGRKWNVYDSVDATPWDDAETNELIVYGNSLAYSKHIAENDPARVLAEVDAKRRIISEHQPDEYRPDDCRSCRRDEPGWEFGVPAEWPCTTLRLMALSYASHPDHQPEWAPEA